jgi:mono/diheme cytochrome c family protein
MKLLAARAAVVTAAIYGYFLLFAQFAFVELMRHAPSHTDTTEKAALGAMALAGILSGFWVAWQGATPRIVRLGLAIAALTSGSAPWISGPAGAFIIAVFTGIAVGLSTVGLAPLIRSWCGLITVGLATGLGYACCNLPFVFAQTPAHQAWTASLFAFIGCASVPSHAEPVEQRTESVFPFPLVLVLFTALVWLDSAAFFIIQHSTDLKSGTWGDHLLWRNAAVHLLLAVVAGLWLKHGGARLLPCMAWGVLAVAAMAVNHAASRPLAGWLYPAAVSLYSVALVAWPAWFSGAASPRAIGWRASWIFAVAGWFGSANGIGMAQSMHRVPFEFIVIAGVCVLASMLYSLTNNWRTALAASLILITAFGFRRGAEPAASSAFERGKQVYLAEGCIHCHSQFVRPGTRDDEYWGPLRAWEATSRPVLIGNRRQGPDLTCIGARRSVMWLKLHCIDPQAFSPGTTMPAYAHLFEDSRGDDLVAYLKQSGESDMPAIAAKASTWQPGNSAASIAEGKALFQTQCSVCHGPAGKGDGVKAASLTKAPANLVSGPFVWSPATADRDLKIGRIIKFGIPGTDMPGHETLGDSQIQSIQQFVLSLRSENTH